MKKLIPALKRVVGAEKSENRFETELKDVSIYDDKLISDLGLSGDIQFKTFLFSWKYDMILRSYGIASLSAVVPNQTVTVSGESYQEDEKGNWRDIPFIKEIDVSDVDIEYVIPDGHTVGDLGLFPVSVENHKGQWAVQFQTTGA